ncbi:hypothetical protein DIPPA_11615 [Diplonema papillatum]|nr:hypothetical protein DIPPA_11615 [Diplonema papillatum]
MVGTPKDKVRGLFDLYQEEKRTEERTKNTLRELQRNSDEVLRAKLRVIEKLLDLKVKDEVSILRKTTNVAVVETNNSLVKKKAEEKLLREVLALVPAAREKYPDAFVTQFEQLASQYAKDTLSEIKQTVHEQLDAESRAKAQVKWERGGGEGEGECVGMVGTPKDKVRGLFDLYQEEKRTEERTKNTLRELQRNSDEVLRAKLRVIEKLLDLKVKDEVSILRKTTNVAVVETNNSLVKKKAEEKLLREVLALVPAAREKYPDAFVTQFEQLASQCEEDTLSEIKQTVHEQLDAESRAKAQVKWERGGGEGEGECVGMVGTPKDKVRGLFDLYQEEKRTEERTKNTLRELQRNSDEVLRAKLRVIEKLLDLKVKDEVSILRKTTNVAVVETNNSLVKKKAEEKLLREVLALVPAAREKYPDAFVTQFEQLASQYAKDTLSEIKQTVHEQLDAESRAKAQVKWERGGGEGEGECVGMVGTPKDKVRGLFDLYQEEKRTEERTKNTLRELQRNSDEVLRAKLRVIEKLLDLKVKDEVSILRKTTNVAVVETNNSLVKKKAEEKLLREVLALVPAAREKYPDAFVTQFEQLASQYEEDTLSEIKQAVHEQLDAELAALRQRRSAVQGEAVKGDAVDRETEAVILNGQKELLQRRSTERDAEHRLRIARVKTAESKLFKPDEVTPASLSSLMRCTPIDFRTDIGKLEAEINDLRNLIYQQRAEEERLLLNRSAKLNNLEDVENDLHQELNSLVTQLTENKKELETKTVELAEMKSAQVPTVGRWAVDISSLEESLEYCIEEEARLKREYQGISHAVNTVDADQRLLNEKVHDSLEEVASLQEQYRQIIDKIERQLVAYKDEILGIRQEVSGSTSQINEMRWTAQHGGEESRDIARSFKEKINRSISQVAIEENLQSMLQAKCVLIEQSSEQVKNTWNQQISEQVIETEKLKKQIDQQLKSIRNLIEELSNLKTTKQGSFVQPQYSVPQLQEMIDERYRQWSAMLFDISRESSNTKAQILVNEEENETLLDEMGHIVVLGHILDAEGLDIETSSTSQLAGAANRLYDDLAAASYRQAKLNQLIRIFRDIQDRRSRGDQVPRLTARRLLSRAARRSKRTVHENTWLAKEIAKQNVSLQSAFPLSASQKPPSPSHLTASPRPDATPQSALSDPNYQTLEQAHKLRVITFIKSEIQPLYNTEQITKKRFIDIVARVSAAYLESHPISPALTMDDHQWLSKKIQEVITLQDDARSRKRADHALTWSYGR